MWFGFVKLINEGYTEKKNRLLNKSGAWTNGTGTEVINFRGRRELSFQIEN